jgi:hypothetical protein
MKDTNQKFKVGDKVEYRPHILDEGEYPFVGIVQSVDDDSVFVLLEDRSERIVSWWDLELFVDYSLLNERERIQYNYRRWVNEYTELFDKTHVTMDEVQSKYSQLAISFAIDELRRISEISVNSNTRLSIEERINHLQSLLG